MTYSVLVMQEFRMCEEMVYVALMLTAGGARSKGPEVAAKGAADALIQGILSTRSVIMVGAMLLRSGSGHLGTVSISHWKTVASV